VAEKIRAIRSDFEFQQGVGIVELFDGFPDFRILRKDEQTVFTGRQADLGGRAQHAFRFDFAHDGLANRETAGQCGSGQRAGHFVPDFVVLRAANDLAESPLARVHLSHFQPIRIRVLNGFHDLRDDDFLRSDAFGNNAFNFDSGEGEKVIDFLNRFSR
jgi:hypothetical protein